jgi:uncharacterized protein (DUF2141 family)
MNRSAKLAVLIAAVAAPVGLASPVTITFEASLLTLDDPIGVFNLDAEIPLIGQFTYDPETMNLLGPLPPGVELPIDIGIYELISLDASVEGLQSFEALEATGVLLNNTSTDKLPIVDGQPEDPSLPVDFLVFGSAFSFPEEQVAPFLGQMQLQLQGDADWIAGNGQLPPGDTIGLENTNAARFVVFLTVPVDFTIPEGDPPAAPEETITSQAVFTITSLSINGEFIQTFQGEIDLAPMGDVNNDFTIDANDLAVMLNNFGQTQGVSMSSGDLNGDGTVNADDLSILLNNFGRSL